MNPMLARLVGDMAERFALTGLMMVPAIVAVWLLGRLKARHRRMAVSPFTGRPLRPPGEALRVKVQELEERMESEALLLVSLPGIAAIAIVTDVRSASGMVLGIVFVVVVLFVVWRWRHLARTARDLWNYRLGFDGERVVGEELNQLMLDGYQVFHDLPFDTFNIDHAVVGPSGVYAVETKAKRKQTDATGRKKEWRVAFDGSTLQFPISGPDRSWVDQAARNARTLGDWLSSAVGETVVVKPILVLPGWLVDRKARGAVNVLNEKEARYALSRANACLSPEQIQRISHQLSEKCRLAASG